jgi:hypothetical protein
MQRTYPVSGTEGDIVSKATPDYNSGERQCSGVKRRPLEDPVKNGACLRNVRPRRGL